MILTAVCWVVGTVLKHSERIKDKFIPVILGAFSVVCATLYVFGVSRVGSLSEGLTCLFTGVTQGVLCAGLSVYGNQLVKQAGKDE